MPAKSVVFVAWTKHDGTSHRPLLPAEYTQMSGRAEQIRKTTDSQPT